MLVGAEESWLERKIENFGKPDPYGMPIQQKSYSSDQDVLFAHYMVETVSVPTIYMDQTEIENNSIDNL